MLSPGWEERPLRGKGGSNFFNRFPRAALSTHELLRGGWTPAWRPEPLPGEQVSPGRRGRQGSFVLREPRGEARDGRRRPLVAAGCAHRAHGRAGRARGMNEGACAADGGAVPPTAPSRERSVSRRVCSWNPGAWRSTAGTPTARTPRQI